MNSTCIPQILVAAPASGSGKTAVTCALLTALRRRGLDPCAFKCGPDYIDPQFHRQVLGVPSKNLDSWFAEESLLRRLFLEDAHQADISIIEGVMGYYDGLGGTTTGASTWEVGQALGVPALLVVGGAGASVSLGALVKGFLEYRNPSGIRGIILNQVSPGFYPRIKAFLEEETKVPVYGYLPRLERTPFSSRHLGLVLPDEIPGIRKNLEELGRQCLETLDMEGLWKLAEETRTAPEGADTLEGETWRPEKERPCICVAKDAAFSFYYKDNLRLLEKLGARIRYISLLSDKTLPADAKGLYLGGGYPELYGQKLEANREMRYAVRAALEDGMPCIAECGGFLYLLEKLEDKEGKNWDMAGFLPGRSFFAGKTGRFGYVELHVKKGGLCGETGGKIRGHEFHYMDTDNNGEGFLAEKPAGNRKWVCGHHGAGFYAGFPHLYFYSCPEVAEQFVRKAAEYGTGKHTGAKNGESENTGGTSFGNPCGGKTAG